MTPERFTRLKQALLRRQHDLTVLADGVHKDHNISAIIRSCDAVGAATLHAVSPGGEVRRHHGIAGGTKRWIDVELHATTESAYAELRNRGFRMLAAHSAPEATDFREIDFTLPTAIVLGSELTGPTPFAVEHADAAISIPMHGLVESLNVSVAAAVILFEAERQRMAAELYSRPPQDEDEFNKTLFEWAHPKIARRCRRMKIAYPNLDADGQLESNPFSDS
jgi:tRNA (guanosine-2'-O-)-methyltransferase